MLGELFNYAFEYILGLQTRDKVAMLADKTIHFFIEFVSKKEFISWEFKSLAEGQLFCSCQPTQLHDSCKLVIRMKFAPNEITTLLLTLTGLEQFVQTRQHEEVPACPLIGNGELRVWKHEM